MTAVSRTIAERYALLEKLGGDGTAVLWRGEDGREGRPVAIKELPLPALDEPTRAAAVERLKRDTAAVVDHPSVVPVHDVVVADGTPFIVMDLVDARTLEDLASSGPLPPRLTAEIGKQVLGALAAAHAAGVVHGDVRPANILVSADGTARLTGFGIAQALDPTGSPAFLAPERIAGHEGTPHSDLWSLGVTLLSATEGANPFRRENVAATLYAVVNDQPVFSRTYGTLADVLRGLLAKAPHARMLPDHAIPMLALAANGAETPVPVLPSPQRPATGIGTPSTAATLAGAAGILFGFYLLGDAMMIHGAYALFDVHWPPILLGRLGIILAGIGAVIGGGVLFVRVRPGQVLATVSASLAMICVVLLNVAEWGGFGEAPQPGLTLDILVLALALVLTIAVWFVPARRTAVG